MFSRCVSSDLVVAVVNVNLVGHLHGLVKQLRRLRRGFACFRLLHGQRESAIADVAVNEMKLQRLLCALAMQHAVWGV